jgi:hypothetical protein
MAIVPFEPRLAIAASIVRRRFLPVPGEVLVHVGDRVAPEDIVAQAPVEGELYTIDLAEALGVSARRVERYLAVQEGQAVAAGTVLARARHPWPHRRQVVAPWASTVLALIEGRLFLRRDAQIRQLRAYLPGEVMEEYPHQGVAIHAQGHVVRGIWGSGGEGQGILVVMAREPGDLLTWEQISLRHRGMIVVGGILEDVRVLYRAQRFRLGGLLVGGMAAPVRALCQQFTLPVVVTEGMGRVPLAAPVLDVLVSAHGRPAVIAGAESQSGPELVVPLPAMGENTAKALVLARPIAVGMKVRLTRPPYLGSIGQVVALPQTPQETTIGTKAEGAQVRLPDGRQIFVPFVNLELLG